MHNPKPASDTNLNNQTVDRSDFIITLDWLKGTQTNSPVFQSIISIIFSLNLLLTNERQLSSTTCIGPAASIGRHFHAVLIIILVIWLTGSPLSVGHVTAIRPMERSFSIDVIQPDPGSTRWFVSWIWKRKIHIKCGCFWFSHNLKASLSTLWHKPRFFREGLYSPLRFFLLYNKLQGRGRKEALKSLKSLIDFYGLRVTTHAK